MFLGVSLATTLAGDVTFRTFSKIGLYQGLHHSNLSIVYPILGLPALVGRGESLEIRVVLHEEIDGEWELAITSLGEIYHLEVNDLDYLNQSWVLNVTVPPQVPEGLYDLSVGRGGTWDFERNAIRVGDIKGGLKLVHLTDVHADRYLGSRTFGERAMIKQLIDVVNLISPDLVVISGDFQGPGAPAQLTQFGEEVLWKLSVPCYLTPGNHEFQQDGESYYRVLNPHPDYAFNYGPVRFISLNQYQSHWEMDLQVGFIQSEQSNRPRNITVMIYHSPDFYRQWVYQSTGPFLTLAGHTHTADALKAGNQSYRLTTSNAVRGLRIIEFSDSEIIRFSYDPAIPKSDVPTDGIEIELLNEVGPRVNYQALSLANDLAINLTNCTWTFDLSLPGPGMETVMLGGSTVRSAPAHLQQFLQVQFDVAAGSRSYIECLNLAPETPEARSLLGERINLAENRSRFLSSILDESGADVDGVMNHIRESLAGARSNLESGNWLQSSVKFYRADTVLARTDVAFGDTWGLIEEYREGGIYAPIVEAWFMEAAESLGEGDYSTALDHLDRISSLENASWILAHDLNQAEIATSEAEKRGEDTTQQGYRLSSIRRLFQEADYVRSRDELMRLEQRWPDIYGASETFTIFFILIVLKSLLSPIDLHVGRRSG